MVNTPVCHTGNRGFNPRRLRQHAAACFGRVENGMLLVAGVVQWQNESFPSFRRGFDSPHPLHCAPLAGVAQSVERRTRNA